MVFKSVGEARTSAVYGPHHGYQASKDGNHDLSPIISGVSLPGFFGAYLEDIQKKDMF